MQPLLHRRVLVTRARAQASALAELLAVCGATPILLPAIEIAPPSSWRELDTAIANLRSFDWLIFTSANAVEAFTERARSLGITPAPPRIAVIGPATARAVERAGLGAVDLTPQQFVAEDLALTLTPHCAGARMLLVRAASARDILPDALTAAGAQVCIAEAYRNIIPRESVEALPELLGGAAVTPVDAITFTSASTARNLRALLQAAGCELPPDVALASIGPITSAEMRTLGIEPTVEAEESTIEALVRALATHFG